MMGAKQGTHQVVWADKEWQERAVYPESQQSSGLVDLANRAVRAERPSVATQPTKRPLDFFTSRVLSVRTLSRPLQVALAVVVLQVLASAVLIALRDALQPRLVAQATGNAVVLVPAATYAFAFASLALAWGLLLAGVLRAHWIARLLVLATFTVVLAISSSTIAAFGAPALHPLTLAQVALVALLWVWEFVARRKRTGAQDAQEAQEVQDGQDTAWNRTTVTFLVAIAVFGAVYALDFAYGRFVFGSNGDVTQLVTLHFHAFVVLLIPAFFLAGSDQAESAQAITSGALHLMRRVLTPVPIAILTFVVSSAILVHAVLASANGTLSQLTMATLRPVLLQLLLGAIIVMLLAVVARLAQIHRWPSLPIPALALALFSILYIALYYGGIQALDQVVPESPHPPQVSFRVYQHTTRQPTFSIAYPSAWQLRVIQDTGPDRDTLVEFDGSKDIRTGDLVVLAVPTVPGLTDEDAVLQQVFAFLKSNGPDIYTLTPAASHGSWLVRTVRDTDPSAGTTAQGEVWIQTTGGQYWIIYGYSIGTLTDYAPLFERSVDSWRPDLTAQAPAPPVDQHAATVDRFVTLLVTLIPLAIGILLGLPLVLHGRRRPRPLAVAGLFMLVAGIIPFAFNLRELGAMVGLPSQNIPDLTAFGIQAIVAIFSLLALIWLVARRQVTGDGGANLLLGLLVLNGSLQVVSWMSELSTNHSPGTSAAPQLSFVGPVLVVLAFLWDLLMSGKEVTNVGSAAFPRPSRVLLYLGYTVLLTASTLYAASETYQVSGGRVPSFTDASSFSQAGLVILGTGLLVTVFLVGRSVQPSPSNAHAQQTQEAQ